MTFDPQTALAIIVPSVTALVWLIRLEGRVNTHDVIAADMRRDLTYIRNRIDRAISHSDIGYAHSRHTDGQDES